MHANEQDRALDFLVPRFVNSPIFVGIVPYMLFPGKKIRSVGIWKIKSEPERNGNRFQSSDIYVPKLVRRESSGGKVP